jgi:hypothetical protein
MSAHPGIIPSHRTLIGKWRLGPKRRVHAHPLRRKIKTAANESERENDQAWGLHSNLLILDYPEEEIRERGQGLTWKYLLLAPRFRTSADNESHYQIWELYLSKHSTSNIFWYRQATSRQFFQEKKFK